MLEILHTLIFIVSIIGGAIIIVTLILGAFYVRNEKRSAFERSDRDSNEEQKR